MLENLNATYDGDMTIRFICFESVSEDEDFREKMLLHNCIGGHLPLSIVFENNRKIYRYDVSGRKSLRDFFGEKCVTEDFLVKLLAELERIFLRGKSYMFSEGNYILHPDAIFLGADGQIGLCYLPGYEKDIQEQLCELLVFLMNCVDVSDRRSVYGVYSTFAAVREGNCTFASLILALKRNGNNIPKEFDEDVNSKEEMVDNSEKKGDAGGKEGKKFRMNSGFKRQVGSVVVLISFIILIVYFLIS